MFDPKPIRMEKEMKLTKLMKMANTFTLGLALATTLPAHAKIWCYEETPKKSAALEVVANPDRSAAAILELDGVFTKYSGTYMFTTQASQ